MIAKELKKLVSDLPDHMEVMVYDEENDFPCRPIRSADVREVDYREEFGGEVMAKEKALVIKFG